MKSSTSQVAALSVSACLALAGAFYAGVAYAADPRLDQASDFLTKATALLKAADNPGPGEFGGHRKEAIQHIEKAQKEIEAAKKWSDAHPPKPPTAPGGPPGAP